MHYTLTIPQATTLQLYSKAIAEKAKELQALNAAMCSTLSDACGGIVSITDKISFDQTTRVLIVEPAPVRTI